MPEHTQPPRSRFIPVIALVVTVVLAIGAIVFGANTSQSASADDTGRTVELTLTGTGGGEVNGRVKLIEMGDQTRVVAAIHGVDEGTFVPHIHRGACDSYDGEPTFPLAVFALPDRSRTTVSASIEELTGSDFIVDIHPVSDKSSELFDPETALACGSLDAELPPAAGGETVTQAPNTGVGPLATRYQSTILWFGLIAALVAATAGLVLNRR